MRIHLGRRGDYAVRAVFHLARCPKDRCKTREIAEAMDIPPKYLPQILSELVRAGLLDAQAGRSGGYSLAAAAEEIDLLQVVQIAEGPVDLSTCVLRGGACDWDDACPVHETWDSAQAAFAAELAATNFSDLAAREPLQDG